MFDMTWNLKTWLKVLVPYSEPKQLADANTWKFGHYLSISDKNSLCDSRCLSVALPWRGDLMSQYRRFSTVAVQQPQSIGQV